VQNSELIMSIPRKIMMTSSTARASVLGKVDYMKCIPDQACILCFTEMLLKGLDRLVDVMFCMTLKTILAMLFPANFLASRPLLRRKACITLTDCLGLCVISGIKC